MQAPLNAPSIVDVGETLLVALLVLVPSHGIFSRKDCVHRTGKIK